MFFSRDPGVNSSAIMLTNLVIKYAYSGHDSGMMIINDDSIVVNMKGFESDLMRSQMFAYNEYKWTEDEYKFFLRNARIDNRGNATIHLSNKKSKSTRDMITRLLENNGDAFSSIKKKGTFVTDVSWSFRSRYT